MYNTFFRALCNFFRATRSPPPPPSQVQRCLFAYDRDKAYLLNDKACSPPHKTCWFSYLFTCKPYEVLPSVENCYYCHLRQALSISGSHIATSFTINDHFINCSKSSINPSTERLFQIPFILFPPSLSGC